MSSKTLNLVVLLSGSGRTLQNLLDLQSAGRLDVRVRLVIGSRANLGGLERAARAGLSTLVIDKREFADPQAFSDAIFAQCDEAGAHLVVLAGWLCLLHVPERYGGKIMNIHPALLPAFGGKGMYGHRVHQAVLDYGCKISGCTVHFVDNTYDNGPVILQRVCPVLDGDTADTLAARVFDEEKLAYPEAIRLFAQGRLRVEGRRVFVEPSGAS